jgi:hypothetical protein
MHSNLVNCFLTASAATFSTSGRSQGIDAQSGRVSCARLPRGGKHKPEAAPAAQKAPAASQNGTGATVAAKPADGIDALLKTLAASNRSEPAATT